MFALVDLRAWAEGEAARLLVSAPRRLAHTRAVAARAHEIVAAVGRGAEVFVAAAWLHDVGYAKDLALTGFHPLDGARYLHEVGAPDRLVNLVARHSCAIVEAKLRGLDREVESFPDECGVVRDALWYCDMTTSPDGSVVSLAERLAEIRSRYEDDWAVAAFTELARPYLAAAVDRTLERLRQMANERQL